MFITERQTEHRLGPRTVPMQVVEGLKKIPSVQWRSFRENPLRTSPFDGLKSNTVEGVATDVNVANGVITIRLERRTDKPSDLTRPTPAYYVKVTRKSEEGESIEIAVQQETDKKRNELPETTEGRAVRTAFMPLFDSLYEECRTREKIQSQQARQSLNLDFEGAVSALTS